jgi:MoaE-MoaD fusion protein
VNVRVRLFALQRELAGSREVPLELPAGATVESAWEGLVERHPVLAPGRPAVRFARNGEYVDASEPLADGDEVACIPPVSGGDAEDNPRLRILELRPDRIASSVLADLGDRLATPADGAIVGFLGRTRESPGTPAPGQEDEAARHAERSVQALEYEALEPMALAVMGVIADEIEARFGVRRLAIVHRTGTVPLGESSIAVVACSPHRDAAFLAGRYAIDEVKARAPIWKAEHFSDGHVWIGEPARSGPRDTGGEG